MKEFAIYSFEYVAKETEPSSSYKNENQSTNTEIIRERQWSSQTKKEEKTSFGYWIVGIREW